MTERGHSETMQTWRLDRGGETMYGFADLIPMKAHLRLPWIAGFDLYPVETLEFKRRILPLAAAENWLCLFITISKRHFAALRSCRIKWKLFLFDRSQRRKT